MNVILLSGGLDSTTLLYYLLSKGEKLEAITFYYGQRHKKEIESVKKITEMTGVKLNIVDISSIAPLIQNTSLIKEGKLEGKDVVVPNRNMILISIAVGYAISIGAKKVYYAAHRGDAGLFPDCREEFFVQLQRAILIASENSVLLSNPFINLEKSDIVKIGKHLNVPFELTWSCYSGGDKECGKCLACKERRKALEVLNENNIR